MRNLPISIGTGLRSVTVDGPRLGLEDNRIVSYLTLEEAEELLHRLTVGVNRYRAGQEQLLPEHHSNLIEGQWREDQGRDIEQRGGV